MQNFYPDFILNTFSRSVSFLIATVLVVLVGCADGTDTTTGTGGTAGTPTLTVSLSTSSLSSSVTATVTATLVDSDGVAMAGEVVTFDTDAGFGTLNITTALTNTAGVATVTLSQSATSPTNGGASSVTATAAGTSSSAGYSVGSVAGGGGGGAVTVGSVLLTASAASAVANGFSLITLQATVLDTTNAPIANQTVTFVTPSGTLSNGQATTDASGVAQVFLTAPTVTGTASVQAYAGNLPSSTVITFTAGLPASITLVTTPTSVSASGSATLVATLKDFYGNAVDAGQTVTFGSSSSTGGHFTDLSSVAASSATTDATGAARMIYVAGTCSTGSCSDFLTATATDGAAQVYAVVVEPIAVGGTVGTPTITIAPFSNTLASGNSVTVTAQVLDDAATPVANTVVTFSLVDDTLATLEPATGTALTDATGNASISLSAVSLVSGATTINAEAQVGTEVVNTSAGFSVGAATITISNMSFGVGAGALSAFGTTSISVDVAVNGALPPTPLTVNFSSVCGDAGKAVVTSTANTVSNGVTATATSSYRDNGCASTDSVTATVSGTSISTNLQVTPPTIGSVQFIAASPTNISLKGIGGVETSQVTFKVVDAVGNPLPGETVSFALSTTVGGITLTPTGTPPTSTSDDNGLAVITVNSGVVSTPVRVTATSGALSTQSSQLTISTGIPDQDSFSLAATKHNVEGLTVDGNTSVLTARLADHFNNPVPDGTAINFTTEGGSIEGSCTTIDGACEVTFTSQNPRPSNGRVTILAYAVGEESFTDLNGNGLADTGEQINANGFSTDKGEAYVDYNANGIRDPNEPFLDFDQDGLYDGPDGLFNGVLCNGSGICSAVKTIHVRQSQVITLSGSAADIQVDLFSDSGLTTPVTDIQLASCNSATVTTPVTGLGNNNAQPAKDYYLRILDPNGNAPPVGTEIKLSATNGTILSGTSLIIDDASSCNSAFPGCPALFGSATFGRAQVKIQSDATYNPAAVPPDPTCANTLNSGALSVTVGAAAPITFDVYD